MESFIIGLPTPACARSTQWMACMWSPLKVIAATSWALLSLRANATGPGTALLCRSPQIVSRSPAPQQLVCYYPESSGQSNEDCSRASLMSSIRPAALSNSHLWIGDACLKGFGHTWALQPHCSPPQQAVICTPASLPSFEGLPNFWTRDSGLLHQVLTSTCYPLSRAHRLLMHRNACPIPLADSSGAHPPAFSEAEPIESLKDQLCSSTGCRQMSRAAAACEP